VVTLNTYVNPLLNFRGKKKGKTAAPLALEAGGHCWPGLRRLKLHGCKFLLGLGPLGMGLTTPSLLLHLDVSLCQALVDTEWLEGCAALQELNLSHCRGIKSLSGVAHCFAVRAPLVPCSPACTRCARP
jgi:hypothetical protein